MTESNTDYRNAYLRERAARDELEGLLEQKTRSLYESNKALEEKVAILERQKALILKTEKMATLGTIAAGVAHEVNNPLAYISSNLESLMDFNRTIKQVLVLAHELCESEYIDQATKDKLAALQKNMPFTFMAEEIEDIGVDVLEGVRRIAGIVGNLLNFSRPKENKQKDVRIDELVTRMLKLAASQLRAIKVETAINEVVPIYCNSDSIGQVVLNLLLNARDACESEPSRKSQIRVSLSQVDDWIVLSVEDNGIGMSDETMTRIFEPFYTTKSVGKGTGLGMSIVYSFIEEHHGRIEVESIPHVGSKLRIFLPVNQHEA